MSALKTYNQRFSPTQALCHVNKSISTSTLTRKWGSGVGLVVQAWCLGCLMGRPWAPAGPSNLQPSCHAVADTVGWLFYNHSSFSFAYFTLEKRKFKYSMVLLVLM